MPPQPSPFNTGSAENTMNAGVMSSSQISRTRLKLRYSNIDFEQCITELCYFLRSKGNQTDTFDRFRVAERALYPEFGAVGINREGILESVLYYWMAANDDSPDIQSSQDDRCMCFVRALYESQRGNNAREDGRQMTNSARINFVDDRNPVDNTICHWGVGNKFAEVFVGMHPDVILIAELSTRILQLLKGFIAEHCYSLNISHADLIAGNFDADQVFTEAVKLALKDKIVQTLGILTVSGEGLMTINDQNYLSESLAAIEYISFKIVRRVGTPEQDMSALEVNNLIADANNQLAQAATERGLRAARASAAARRASPIFDYARICIIIRQILPVPTNQSHVFGDAWFEDRSINTNREIFRTQRAPLPTYMSSPYSFYYNPTPAQLEAAMQPQAATISQSEVDRVMELRLVARGMRRG